jgi:simple sugar transport system permease protein
MNAPAMVQAAKETRYTQRTLFERFRAHPAGGVTAVFLLVFGLCVVSGLLWPQQFRFLSVPNMNILMRAIPTLGIMSLGAGLLMIAGEYDLSIGAVFGLSSYVMVACFVAGLPIVLCVAAAVAVGIAIGLINGFITTRYSIPSFITTLGTLFIFRSGGNIVSGNQPLIFTPPEWFSELLTGELFGLIQMQFVWYLVLAGVAYVLLNRHWLGNHFFAVGGNRTAALQVGIDVRKTKLWAFVLCSVFTVLAGVIAVVRLGTASTEPMVFLELEAVAACVMGGIALNGGRGSMLGVVVGACMFHLVKDVILLTRLPAYYLDLFVGVVIVFGVTLNQAAKKRY